MREQGISAAPLPTTGPRTATALARQAVESGADMVLVAGGDGTINEAANGMIPSHVPLGILPAGTANVLATELGLGGKLERAAQHISQYVPERIAVGLLRKEPEEPRYFLLMAGVGLDAHIVYNVHLGLKAAVGKLAYWIAGLPEFTRQLDEFDVRVEGQTFRCGFALASRVRNYGGDLEIASNASLAGDDFEVVLFQGRSPFRFARYLLGVLTRRHTRMKGIAVLRSRRLEFPLAGPPQTRVYVQVDGEFAGQLPVSVEMVPDALTLLVPSDFRQRLGIPAIARLAQPAWGAP